MAGALQYDRRDAATKAVCSYSGDPGRCRLWWAEDCTGDPIPPETTEKDSILLADFVNTTVSGFRRTLKQALAVQLEQSPYSTSYRIRQSARRSNSWDARRGAGHGSVAREICERENIKAMLSGSIAALGSQYVIAIDAEIVPPAIRSPGSRSRRPQRSGADLSRKGGVKLARKARGIVGLHPEIR